MRDDLLEHARQREKLHEDHASSRPLSPDYEVVGVSGEEALARFVGSRPDLALRPGGDAGQDQRVSLYINGRVVSCRVDVKAARKPYNLIVEVGKVMADIYILGRFDDATLETELLGWATHLEVRNAPTKDFGYGVINHYMPARRLHDMGDFRKRIRPS